MIIYGRRKIRIKKYDDFQIRCEKCKGYEQRFSVYQEYFHVFFIPIYPSSIKTINCVCLNCHDSFNQEKTNHYLKITKTPIYLYSGVILFIALIITLLTFNILTQKQKNEYIQYPKIGDVYLISQDYKKDKIFYFLKIKAINADTIELYHGSLQYNRFISNMNDSDYFVKEEIYKILKSDLKNYLDKGLINSVERYYGKNSRFTIEK